MCSSTEIKTTDAPRASGTAATAAASDSAELSALPRVRLDPLSTGAEAAGAAEFEGTAAAAAVEACLVVPGLNLKPAWLVALEVFEGESVGVGGSSLSVVCHRCRLVVGDCPAGVKNARFRRHRE